MADNDQQQKLRGDIVFEVEDIGEHQVKHNHLLAIAVDYYEDDGIADLNNCVNDIEGNAQRDGLIQLLTKYYFFSKENIYFLRSRKAYRGRGREELKKEDLSAIAAAEQEEKGYAFVGEADHRTIIAQLKYLAKNITPEDNLLICFSGHGIYDQDFDEGYWIPSDAVLRDNASYIENGTIRTALNAIKSHHTVLFSDSCYSGTLFSAGQTRSLEVPRVYNDPSRWGITAGRKEPVSDGALGENSPFARELLRILGQRREIWIGDLISEIIKNIEDKNDKQTPVGEALSFIKGHKNGQFVFLPKLAKEIDYWRIAWKENTRKGYFSFLARYPEGEYEETALEALNVFAVGKKPGFSEAALQTFDFLNEAVPGQAKAYLGSSIRGETRAVLSPTAIQMFRDLKARFSEIAENELKSFILLGENFSDLPALEEAYVQLAGDTHAKDLFFQHRFIKRFKNNPYRGFDPYQEQDNKVFFGRRAVIQELADKLQKDNLLVISAPPYAGKTSVVRAGLYPLLKEREGYELLELPPGEAISSYLHRARILPRIEPGKKQLLVIDPYEQLFAESVDREERMDYESALQALCQGKPSSSLKIIICLRANFETRLRSSDFGKFLWREKAEEAFFYRLPGLTKEEWWEVIAGPMWSRFYDYETDALPGRILEEVQNMPNALALLSFALQRLYEETDDKTRTVTARQYEELGRVRDALNKVAEEKLYDGASPGEERALRRIFLRMAEPIGGGNYGSRMVWIEEISCPNEEENEVAKSIFNRLGQHEDLFKVVREEGKVIGLKPRDLLVSSWSRYREWIEEFGQENLALQRSLWEASIKQEEELSARDMAGGYSNYWDNNPNLPRILYHVLGTGTELLLEDDKNELNRSIEELQRELSGQEQSRFQELITKWKEERKPEYLDEFILTGVSGRLLEIFLQQPTHWLNRTEAEFIRQSWEKRSGDITRVYRERDEAVAARQEALAAKMKIQEQIDKTLVTLRAALIGGQLLAQQLQTGKLSLDNEYAQAQLHLASIVSEQGQIIQRGHYDPDLDEGYIRQYLHFSHLNMGEPLQKLYKLKMEDRWIPLIAFDFAPNAITYLQFFLVNAGFLPIGNLSRSRFWGIYGYETLAAVRLFQEYIRTMEKDHYIDVTDGIVGPVTWRHLLRWVRENKKCHYHFTDHSSRSTEHMTWFDFLGKLKTHLENEPAPTQQLIDAYPQDSDTQKLTDWNLDPAATHLIGIRRNADRSVDRRSNDDLFIFLFRGHVYKFWGSTDPNPNMKMSRPEDPYLAEGQHVYRLGWHKRNDEAKIYKALLPANQGVLVFRDRNNDNALDESDLSKGLEGPNASMNFHWSGIGSANFSAGANVIAGGSYVAPEDQVVDCRDFAASGYRELGTGKTQGAYNVFMDLLTINGDDLVYYNLISEKDLALAPAHFPPDYAESVLGKLKFDSQNVNAPKLEH